MNLSHFLEKLKIGKKYVLLDMVIHPDCEQPWQSAGPENKFIPVEVWRMIYEKLEDICQSQFNRRGRAKGSKYELDTEYECRLDSKPTYLLKYQFKDENTRTILHVVFNGDVEKLHKECLMVQIVDETMDLFQKVEDQNKTIEKLNKKYKKLKEQSSLMNSSDKIAYAPDSLGAPIKSESYTELPASDANENAIVGKRRRRRQAVFDSDDENEVNSTSTSAKVESPTRKQMPRKTKAQKMIPEEKSPLPSCSVTKRRRKEDEGTQSSPKDESNKDKRRKSKKDDEEKTVATPTKVDHDQLRKDAEKMRKMIVALEMLNKSLPEDKTLLDVPVLNCHEMSADEINATFVDYREELKEIYDEHKDKSERELLETSLCNWQEVTSVLSDQQTYVMISRLEQFNSAEQSGMYTEFLASTLVMEWGLRIWMKKYDYTDRKQALARIKLQEEANPLEITPTTLNSLMGHRRRKH
ncbi:uncharacterized protein LOC134204041 isoform X3 [Armigeres subalbatus]|uniref:uncharacterized protein LOC134204041 isoform X3 n=1 Tax=Armigeres subalbatus TaxID=124917 RepID=UPI002ED2B044